MSRVNRYAGFKLKQVWKHPYAWLIIIIVNLYFVFSLIGFQDTLKKHNIKIPGDIFTIYLTGSWFLVTFGMFIMFVLFAILYYQTPILDKQIIIRLGGRNALFCGKIVSFLYLSVTYLLSITLIPIIVGFIIGNTESGWGEAITSASSAGDRLNIHPIIDQITANSSFVASTSPFATGLIHLILLWWSLFILIILLDVMQHLLKSILWGTVIVLGYCMSYVIMREVSLLEIFFWFDLQVHSLIVYKIPGEGFIPYSYSIGFFITVTVVLLTLSYWKERFLHL